MFNLTEYHQVITLAGVR